MNTKLHIGEQISITGFMTRFDTFRDMYMNMICIMIYTVTIIHDILWFIYNT